MMKTLDLQKFVNDAANSELKHKYVLNVARSLAVDQQPTSNAVPDKVPDSAH